MRPVSAKILWTYQCFVKRFLQNLYPIVRLSTFSFHHFVQTSCKTTQLPFKC